ncbi:LuxR C-terminal-related transcriptional regulator [Streptomyces sp. NPDC001401]|uniref:LuxR C-terminal-related transcriptional regulator n=1 Tax=Streptomyces sp. NPDC001401 TaxID=3364570 RepID=UPI0036AFA7A4
MTGCVDGALLLGRSHQWENIEKFLAASSGDYGNVLTLEGPAGTGKTRLLQDAERLAADLGFVTASFSLPSREGSSGDGGFESFLAGLESGSVGTSERLLVVVDDFHHATEALLDRVLSVRARRSHPHVAWLLALRSCCGSRSAKGFLGHGHGVTRVDLEPLSDEEAIELAAGLLGAKPATEIISMVKDAGGNPLLVTELVSGLCEEQNVEIHDGLARLKDFRTPRRIREVAARWLNALSEKSHQLIQIAAAMGGPFMIGELAAMQGETTASILPAVNEVMAAGLLVFPAEQAVFQHELIRRAVAEALPSAVRTALSEEIGALRNPRPLNALIASEFHGAPGGATAKTAPVHISVPTVVQEAVALNPADRFVPALLLARSTRGESLPLGLAEEIRAELTRTLADVHVTAATEVDKAARRVVSLLDGDSGRVRRNAQAILDAHTGGGSDADVVTATALISNLEWAKGDLAAGLRWGRRAVSRIGEFTPPMWRPYVRLALAAKLSDVGQFDEAEELISTAREEADRAGLTGHTAAILITRARLLLQASRLQEAQDAAQAGLDAAVKAGSSWVVPVGQAVLILVALRRGDLSSAADYVWRTRAVVSADRTVFPSIQYSWGEFLVSTAQLAPRRAAELLTTQYVDLLAQPQLYVEEVGAAPWLVRLALAADDTPLAATVVAGVEAVAAANPDFPSVGVSAAHARGLLEKDTGALRRASREHLSPCSGALADEDLGALLAADEGRGRALALDRLRSALHRFQQFGANADAARVQELINRHIASAPPAPAAAPAPARAPARRAGRPASQWESLSETERTIASLVSEGMTNRQVARRVALSPHTVNYHLRAIFRKLGISSRVEVTRYVTQGVHESP